VVFRGPEQVKPACFGGHKGFGARAGEDRLHLNAFILEPGTYRCDDQVPVIFLTWAQTQTSAEYQLSDGELDLAMPVAACP
jgi:hypothetical protein